MDDELRIFRKTVRQFIQEQFVPQQARWREQHGPGDEAWTAIGKAGILLPDFPQEYGGGGGTFAHETVVSEEHATAGVHFGSSIQSIVGHYILSYGTEEYVKRNSWDQKKKEYLDLIDSLSTECFDDVQLAPDPASAVQR